MGLVFGVLGFWGGEVENRGIDAGEDCREEDTADHVGGPVHVGEDAADRDQDDTEEHETVEDDESGAAFEIFGQDDDGKEEDGGGDHGVSGGEAGLAGAVGADVQDDEFFEEDKDDGHERQR